LRTVLPDNGYDGRNWRDDFQLTLHVQDDVRVTRPTGNIFLTNIHRVYAGNDVPPSADDENTMDYFLGPRPTGGTTESKVDLGMIVRDIDELAVLMTRPTTFTTPGWRGSSRFRTSTIGCCRRTASLPFRWT
jgi:hypothetical protein